MAGNSKQTCGRARIGLAVTGALVASALALAVGDASAQYLGASYLQMPGVTKAGNEGNYSNWVRFEGFYWKNQVLGRAGLRRIKEIRFPAPTGPKQGPGELVAAIDKRSKLLRSVMASCAAKTVFPELTFSINAEQNAPLGCPAGAGRRACPNTTSTS